MSRTIAIEHNNGGLIDYDGESDELFGPILHQVPPVFKDDEGEVMSSPGFVYFNYTGNRTEAERPTVELPPAEPVYKKYLTGSEVIKLTGVAAYGAIKTAAAAGDAVADYFVDIAREINVEGEKIWIGHDDYIAAVNHFAAAEQLYIDEAKQTEMLTGLQV